MHPSDEIRGSTSNRLTNKTIILGVTGSIAAVETIKLSRELIRHGANIIPVMTKSSTKIIHPDSLWFATGNKPIVELTGSTEHVTYLGKVKKPADLLLICPCTANTISKITYGIDDTSVTTFATTAIGSKIPVLLIPAMHLSMYNHSILQKNIKKLKTIGINFIDPFIERNIAKMPNNEEIIAHIFRQIGKKDYDKKKILIIGGPTAEQIDNIRIITNRSSGKTSINIAKNAFYRGADVTLWYGRGKEKPPEYIITKYFESIYDLEKIIKKTDFKKFDIIIICAAISDYIPKKYQGKIPSGKEKLVIEMKPSFKIISEIRKKAPKTKIIGFKAEENKHTIKNKSMELLDKNRLDFVVSNTLNGFEKDENEIWIYTIKGQILHKKDQKEKIADIILDNII